MDIVIPIATHMNCKKKDSQIWDNYGSNLGYRLHQLLKLTRQMIKLPQNWVNCETFKKKISR